MPELPEVETVRRALEDTVQGKTIKDIKFYYDKIVKNIEPEKFAEVLKGKTITQLNRRGKHLIMNLEDLNIIIHLRMEGKLFYYEKLIPIGKHDHIVFEFTDGTYLIYNDTRKFGTMDIVYEEEMKDYIPITKLGPEANSSELTAKYLKDKIKNSSRPIKTTLLDQTVINGLGNIYADEVLFASKIHPLTPSNKLKPKDYENLVANSISIINKAIENKGTTFKSFAVSENESGEFQHQLKVYGKKGEPCPTCQTPLEKIKIGGRSATFCPKCQKI